MTVTQTWDNPVLKVDVCLDLSHGCGRRGQWWGSWRWWRGWRGCWSVSPGYDWACRWDQWETRNLSGYPSTRELVSVSAIWSSSDPQLFIVSISTSIILWRIWSSCSRQPETSTWISYLLLSTSTSQASSEVCLLLPTLPYESFLRIK